MTTKDMPHDGGRAAKANGAAAVVALLLAVAVLAVYWQVRAFEFISYDDEMYVSQNPVVRAGLTAAGFLWAFGAEVNWHPLAWLSHMLDCELFGLNAGAHHFVNVLFHVANTVLLFLVLRRMTGALWQSAFVAALFGVHPLRVESVAWVSERKDVLSTFFWMMTLWTYAWYVERPNLRRHLVVTSAFILGLLSKPMLVTLPFALLLLDYWPLRRLGATSPLRLVGEKIPWFLLAAAASVITFVAQRQLGAVTSLEAAGLTERVANTLVSYAAYLGKMVWPLRLAPFYPHPFGTPPLGEVIVAGTILVVISLVAVRTARTRPYLLIGWSWYLGTLVPVAGFVQIGEHSIADRYTYIPLIGIFMMLSWGIHDLLGRGRWRAALTPAASTVVLGLMFCTWIQVGHWRNSIALFEHTLAVTERNYLAHSSLGYALTLAGRNEEAVTQYQRALAIWPHRAWMHLALTYRNFAATLERQGRTGDARDNLAEAVRLDPEDPKAHDGLGIVLSKLGRFQEAADHHIEALRLLPNTPAFQINLGYALEHLDKNDEAAAQYEAALKSNPDYGLAHRNLGILLQKSGRNNEAIGHLATAINLGQGDAQLHSSMGVALGSAGKLDEAVEHFSIALKYQPNNPKIHNNIGLTQLRQGKVQDAISSFSEALRLDPNYKAAQDNLAAAQQNLHPTATSEPKEKVFPKL